jgi:penicillin-binding protein 1A
MKKIKVGKKKNNVKHNAHYIWNIILFILIGIASLCLLFGLFIIISSPDFDKDKLYSKESTILYYNNGEELARTGSNNRTLVTYDQLPQVLVDAIVATEDSRFFQHNGLDGARFLKAAFGQLSGSSSAGGASTITMQVVKNTYTSKDASGLKGIVRKFTDIYMAVFKVENSYTKEEIMEFYVNSQWLGNDGNINYSGIAGVEQASEFYFGKSVSDLTLAEASLLAGMFQNPSLYNPYNNPNAATKRQDTVLTLMVRHGYITEEQKDEVQKIPISSLLSTQATSNGSNQAAIDYILNEAQEKTGDNPYKVSMKIYTTIDPSVQNTLNSLENGDIYKFPNDYIQEGLAVTSTEDGSISGLSGGRNYTAKGTNRSSGISRQPGSTAKIIFDYGPYIEYLNGSTYSPFLDEPTTYSNGSSIKDADGTYYGLMTMRNALVNSRNIPALRCFKQVEKKDINLIANFAHSLGIDYGDNLYESASIGGFDGVSPLQMSAAYAAFARGGYYIEPYSITKITLNDTGKTEEYKYTETRVMSEETAYMITSMLISAAESGVGGVKVSGVTVGAKSGTSTIDASKTASLGIPGNSIQDSWNITTDPKHTIALWLGYDKTTTEHYLTVGTANPARIAIMRAVGSRIYTTSDGTFEKPSGVVSSAVEMGTYPAQLPSDYTPSNLIVTELFKEGTEPTEVSTRFSKLNNVTNAKATNENGSVKVTWDAIDTPDAINTTYLQKFFNDYYEDHASGYYEGRLSYNASYIGTLEYLVYLNTNGSLTLLGSTDGTSYTYTPTTTGTNNIVIKSAYTIFRSNMSDGTETSVNVTSTSGKTTSDDTDKNNTNTNNNDGTSTNKSNPINGLSNKINNIKDYINDFDTMYWNNIKSDLN